MPLVGMVFNRGTGVRKCGSGQQQIRLNSSAGWMPRLANFRRKRRYRRKQAFFRNGVIFKFSEKARSIFPCCCELIGHDGLQ